MDKKKVMTIVAIVATMLLMTIVLADEVQKSKSSRTLQVTIDYEPQDALMVDSAFVKQAAEEKLVLLNQEKDKQIRDDFDIEVNRIKNMPSNKIQEATTLLQSVVE